ncbi:uncharacterized protein LOC116299183 [Actinia tenebrosa]|uniref:Uncharacterized protein LOC116299183 n=1 Tax=Actinia tenebrosa TaxID=6105 RepID=A0A6P8ICU4_ACTTE|nr:uncharacterized protein LOC116299183 [Actinia tenebrosa]
MNDTQVQWIGSSCGRHGSYTFYKGFKINSRGKEKSYCLGEFYFVRNSEDRPICIAELQLIWHDASIDSKLASARLYFKPENTPLGRHSIHGKDELLYADQKVIIKCEDMAQWECSGSSWTTGLIPTLETDFVPMKDVCIDKYTGKPENKYRLQNTPTTDDTPTEKIIILTFQAYCRYIALQKRLLTGITVAKSEITSLGGIIAPSKSTKIVFCRDCFSCPDLDQFHLSGEHKAPVLKGRPRKKKIRSSTLAKELKRKRFLADLERVKKNLPSKKIKLSESEEGTESDLSEESSKSYESMDEDKPCVAVETPLNKIRQPNGFLHMKIKQEAKVISISENELKNTIPPPLVPTSKVKLVPALPPPLQKIIKIQTESSVVPKVDAGPPPLYPAAVQKIESVKKTSQSVPRLLPRVDVPGNNRMQGNEISSSSSKAYTAIKSRSIGLASSSASPTTTGTKPEMSTCNGMKSVDPLCNTGKQTLVDGKSSRVQPSDDMKMEGKENQQDSNKADVMIKTKKKRIRQPCNVKELNEEFADEDEKYFMRSLREFMKSRDTPISKIPALGFKRVNLWTMYNTAQKLGGYDMVTSKRLWRQVYDALGGSTTITSAATYTRRHYERLLLPYETYVRSQLNNKKGLPEQTQLPNTSSGQDSTSKGHPINSTNQAGTTTIDENNSVTKDSKTQSSHDNQRGTDSQPITATSNNNNSTLASLKASNDNTDLIKQSGSTKANAPVTTDSKLLIKNNISRHSASSSVVKVKPNGVIAPYSVSVQNIKKNNVTSSSFVVVTKSINDQSAPLIRSSTIALPKTSSASTLINKLDTHGSSNVIQNGTTVTPRTTAHESASSHSSRTIIIKTPVKNPTPETYPLSIKHEAVKVVQVQNPQNHSIGPPQQQVSVTSPKIYLPQKQSSQSNTSKENVGHRVNYMTKSGHPVSNEEGRTFAREKAYEPEKRSSEPTRTAAQNSSNHKRELKHVGEPIYQDHTPHHQTGNVRDSRTYEASSQQNIGRSSNKRRAQNDFIASDEMKRKIPDEGFPHRVVCHNQGEPIAKRRKTPSPSLTKVTNQPQDVIQDVTTQSHGTCHLAYRQNDAIYSSCHTIKAHDDGCGKLYNAHAGFNQGIQNERKVSHLEQIPVQQTNFQKEVVDLTESSVAKTSASDPIAYPKPSKSPSYTRITHTKQQYLVEDSCQRTEPRLYGNVHNTRVNQSKNLTASLGHPEDKQSKDSHLSRGHYKETYPNPQHNFRLVEEVKLPMSVERKQSKVKVEQNQLNSEVHRTITHRTFAESPDEHFQEWRRRQGMTQYPAYITVNQNEQTRRSSITEQPVTMCPHTPPIESRYLYVQENGAMHPRVIEEVPLILSSKPGMYYQEDSFYSGVPFYHGGWNTAGVADGVTFKGDPETISNNSHLRSSSCIFMPTSQMFGSAVPIAPLSPPVLNQDNVMSGQETVSIHPHLLMTSSYSHNHQMVSQNPTRPLHSYT